MDNALPRHGEHSDAMSADTYRQPVLWLVVWVGGTVGTGLRFVLSEASPTFLRIPVGILGINIVGAFLLGVLMSVLQDRGPDLGRRRLVRLLLGTGLLGGFTTYSALAVDTVTLARGGLTLHAVGYAGATVLIGALSSVAGIALGERHLGRGQTP